MSRYEVDIRAVQQNLEQASRRLQATWEQAEPPSPDIPATPSQLREALSQLLEILARWDSDTAREQDLGLDRLGVYALDLISELSSVAGLLGLEDLSRQIELQSYPLAVWLARHGGRLTRLEPVVNAVAFLANHTTETEDLGRLFKGISELVEAVSPSIRKDLEESGPGRPWRLLVLNRAIVATRSHDPDLMEAALTTVAEYLPDEAPRFFAEGMQQMDLLGYPSRVRRVMQRFFDQWGEGRRMH
jgi:hypothetical protein